MYSSCCNAVVAISAFGISRCQGSFKVQKVWYQNQLLHWFPGWLLIHTLVVSADVLVFQCNTIVTTVGLTWEAM